jgi:amidase
MLPPHIDAGSSRFVLTLAEYASLDGCAAGALVASGAVQPRELAQRAIEAIELLNPRLRAVVEVYADALERPAHVPVGNGSPLAGVPILRKDLMAFERGRLCENGSELSRGFVAALDSEIFVRIRAAGIHCIGRSATAEFGYSTATATRVNGATCNPYDPALTTGGSSGGAAAAVASGMVPLAHGSDTGGSIRTPAGWTGLVGLKPTRGRVSEAPAGAPSFGMTTSFALTRSVRDTAALLDVMQGPAPGAPFVIAPPARSYLHECAADPGRLRIGVVGRPFGGQRLDAPIAAVLDDVARALEAQGHRVDPVDIAFEWETFLIALNDVWTAHLAHDCDTTAASMGRRPCVDTLQATLLNCYEHGRRVPAIRLVQAVTQFDEVSRLVARAFETADVLLTPTSTQLPPPHAVFDADDAAVSPLEWARRSFDFETFMVPFNVTGHPAISLPLGRSSSGIPIGVQLIGLHGREDILLRLAGMLERTIPWSIHVPPLHVAARA